MGQPLSDRSAESNESLMRLPCGSPLYHRRSTHFLLHLVASYLLVGCFWEWQVLANFQVCGNSQKYPRAQLLWAIAAEAGFFLLGDFKIVAGISSQGALIVFYRCKYCTYCTSV